MDISQNYFQLFDLPIQFPLDEPALTARYRKLQLQFHPDRFASKSAQEQRLSAQLAAFINQAYDVLSSPITRAEYLLSLRFPEDIQAASGETTLQDNAFLMEQMELREHLSVLTEKLRQGENQSQELADFDALMMEKYQLLQSAFVMALSEDDAVSAQCCVDKMRYYHKLLLETAELRACLMASS